MPDQSAQEIIEKFLAYIHRSDFPCIAARSAVANEGLQCLVVNHMACPHHDHEVLKFLYRFVDEFRLDPHGYQSAAVIYELPEISSEEVFEELLWKRLQGIVDLDSLHHGYDPRVDSDPISPHFSFSIKGEACFIIGLHPASARAARHFSHPVLVFNPHAQFVKLRDEDKYEQMKEVIRKRDMAYSGSYNPMLRDFGESSEVLQYSGSQHNDEWVCPLKINHEPDTDHPSP